MSSISSITQILKRPELLTLIIAAIMQVAVAVGLPARAGLPIPQDALTLVVGAFWAVFVGTVFEGKFKGVDYTGGFSQLLGSLKFRAALSALGVASLAGVLQLFNTQVPEDSLKLLIEFLIALILGKGGLDGAVAAFGK